MTLNNTTGNVTVTLGNVAGFKSAQPLVVPVETIANPAALTLVPFAPKVSEGGVARFSILADPTINRDIIVEVDVKDLATKGTNFVDNGSHFVRLPAGENNVFFEVQTKTDTTATTDGVLVGTIQDGAGYTHRSPSNTALTLKYKMRKMQTQLF